ncbi:auxin response factor 16 [Actinidia rufa]|uniref:Auxin response factor n=1 Tax=Actinidia rufa TaxID=165716 RepID=A0A7J0F3T2_9ERIC|nr:auxin response factor 16 [Actinidia rufa]
MITFIDSKDKVMDAEKCLDSQLWHACAGSMVQMSPVNTKVFYFPQGHAEHASGNVDFRNFPKIPSYIACRVLGIKFMADPETDEVYAKIRLVPIGSNEVDYEETIFPRLDYTSDPPVQTILAKDVHGETWKFRHIYRGTPRRHLLTTGWSNFVNHKKLVAGDSIVFLRAENGDLCVGIRRAKRGIGGGPESSSGWNPSGGNCIYGRFSAFLREDENKLMRNGNGGNSAGSGSSTRREKVKPESVIEAATLAANGQPFEVVYYPRASTPEFCVRASLVKAALQIRWCSGMRFKMAFETEDSSRISWFMGTISSVQVADPIRWPDSPWRLLQVTWDEPELLQNVKHISPWLVELVSNIPTIHLSPFSPPRKKLRLPQHPDFPLDCQFQLPTFSGNLFGPTNPFNCLPDNPPAGMQGARHAQYGLSLSDLHLNKLHSETSEKSDAKGTQFVLFGKPILTEQQLSLSCSGDPISPVHNGNSSSEGNADKMANISDGSGSGTHLPLRSTCEGLQWCKYSHRETETGLEIGHCKVFMESENVGRNLDLSMLGSYEELYRKLASMFDIESSEMMNHVLYWDVTGSVKQVGDEPFCDFMKTAKRLTILTDSSSDNVGM